MKYPIARVLGIGFLVATTGCIQTFNEYTINPDGSGKVNHRSIVHPMNFQDLSPPDPEKQAASAVKTLLNESSGVDVWKDVQVRITADQGIELSGTAYFPDLTKLKLNDGGGVKTAGSDLRFFSEGGTLSVQIGEEEPEEKPFETQALSVEELHEKA